MAAGRLLSGVFGRMFSDSAFSQAFSRQFRRTFRKSGGPYVAENFMSGCRYVCSVVCRAGQAHSPFDAPLAQAAEADGQHRAAAIHSELGAQRARRTGWLKRRRSAGSVTWRPRKQYRVAAWRWLRALGRQRCLTMGVGLKRFTQAPRQVDRGPWDTWPRLSMALGCGSDGSAAANAALRKLHVNLDVTPEG